MSPCRDTYRRCASFALVLALVLIALPSLLNAQTAPKAPSDDTLPKAEWFIGYQWLNPGGNIPDQTPPPVGPLAFKLPSIPFGVGTSLAYNFTKNLALEGDYGLDFNPNATINTLSIGPKVTWRGEGVNFFAHTLFGFERLSATGDLHSNGIAAILGGGMDIKFSKSVTIRLLEADFQWSRQNFANIVPIDGGALRRPELPRCPPAHRSGVQFRRSS